MTSGVSARVVTKVLPWQPNEAYPVPPVIPGGYLFFTPAEAAAVDAIVDRLIPTDELGPGAKDAGVTTFIDRQLTGPYGGHDWLYMQGPFSVEAAADAGAAIAAGAAPAISARARGAGGLLQGELRRPRLRPAQRRRAGQAARRHGEGRRQVRRTSPAGCCSTPIYANTMEGFFADPIYGGNRDMAGWKLVGFPGVRYDFRDVIDETEPGLHAAAGRHAGPSGVGRTLMARRLPRKDVVIVGLGWTGSIMALELARTGLDVVAIERGPWRDTATDFNIGTAPDELRYAVRHDVFLRPKQETLTMRNNPSQTALPIRKWGSFLPGNGVGGAGVHWNGQTWRFLPDDFRIRSHMIERYGEGIMPEGNHIQDWPVTYDELEPYYDKFEYVAGISGKAGNIKGADPGRRQSLRRRARARISDAADEAGLCAGAVHQGGRRTSACIRSRVRPPTSRSPTPTRTAAAWRRAPIAASASGSAAPTIRRPARRPACCRRWSASRPSRRAPNAR